MLKNLKSFFKNYWCQYLLFRANKDILEIQSNLYSSINYSKEYKPKNKKVFCILEQGNESNNKLTEKRKQKFNTEFSDCIRLNWANNNNDKLANYFSKNICWSEGRSYLYEKVKGEYDFYIFIDDDVDIKLKENNGEDLAILLRDQLLKHNPIHGSIPNDAWPTKNLKNNFGEIFKMKGGDLCVQIFRDDFAKCMFPTWEHGSGKSMWYCQFIAHILFTNQSLYLNKFQAFNTRHVPHQDISKSNYNDELKVIKSFVDSLSKRSLRNLFKHWREYSLSNHMLSTNKFYSYEIKKKLFNNIFKK